MIVNKLLATLQRIQLLCKGHLAVRVLLGGKEYHVLDVAVSEDQVTLTVKEVQC